jgi:hypothetical protein
MPLVVSEDNWKECHANLERLAEFAQADGNDNCMLPVTEYFLLDASGRLEQPSWEEMMLDERAT